MQLFNHDKLDFEVDKFKLEDVPIDIGMGIRRKDNGKTLGIVSKNYKPLQYLEATLALEESIKQAV